MPINYVDHLGGGSSKAVSTKPQASASLTQKEGSSAPVTLHEEQVSLPPVVTATPPAIITVGAGRTINLGNFNSAKVEVHLSYPCAIDDLEAGWEFAYGWVEEKVGKVLKDSGVES